MSYCRFSTNDWRCDLYCYESDRCFVTHTAGNRKVGRWVPSPGYGLLKSKIGRWWWGIQYRLHLWSYALAPRRDLALPHAGETFMDGDLESFRERLVWLRSLGYRFPDYVLTSIDEEIAEEKP
jgi:hypothetical protein